MTTIAQLIRVAQEAIGDHRQPAGVEAERSRLHEVLQATQDVNEAGRLYDALLGLPYTAPRPSPPDREFAAWCATGRLPTTVEGLQDVSTVVELYRP